MFLGLTVTAALGKQLISRFKVVAMTTVLALLLPVGALAAIPVSGLSKPAITGFFAFGLVALLYLVTEELFVEAHEIPDRHRATVMFFGGFLLLFMLEQTII